MKSFKGGWRHSCYEYKTADDISIIDSVLLVINDSLHIQMKLNIEMFNEYTYAINSIYSDFIITHLMERRITNN